MWNRTVTPKTLLVTVLSGAVAATVYAAVNETFARGTIAYVESFKGPGDVVFQKLTLPPGDHTIGWHYHNGEVVAVVSSGTLTEETPCGGTDTISAGQGFLEHPGEIHRVYNEGADPVVIYLTNMAPLGVPRTVFVDAPVCIGPPASADECRADGWQTFTVPRLFKNEGDCVSWVESGHRP
jgi:quercetin dioxygenase-like cupin family protein